MFSKIINLTRLLIPQREAATDEISQVAIQGASRIASLDGLRAASILIVLVYHFSLVGRVASFFKNFSTFGVQVFFVISGYLITRLLAEEHERLGTISLKAFYLRRFFRIVPAAYCYFGILFVFSWAAFRPVDILSLLTFTSNYNLGRPVTVAHIWSLSVEEQFYILWPITLSLFFYQRARILLWAICLSPFFILAFHVLNWDAYRGSAFPASYDSLALGCLAAVLAPKLEFLRSRWFFLSGPLAILLQWIPWTGRISGLVHILFLWPIIHLSIAIFMVHAIHRRYWLLNTKPVVWIGNLSYSLYLWHIPFLVEPRLATRFSLIWIFACATLSYYLVERPFLRLRRRMHPRGASRAPGEHEGSLRGAAAKM